MIRLLYAVLLFCLLLGRAGACLAADEKQPLRPPAVPLVVCFFSYLFSVCVLLGVWTRSTVAAILLTIASTNEGIICEA